MKATLKDIAARVGVTSQLVSFYLNHPETTREANGKTGQTNGLNYNYKLSRYYASDLTQCDGTDDNGKALCADFCGIDTPKDSCCSDGTSSKCAAPGTGNAAATGD